MAATTQPAAQLRPFTVIGYSVNDEILCRPCLTRTTPITGEKVSHICRRGPRPVPDNVRKQVLALDRKKVRPSRIAAEVHIALATVMQVLSGDDADAVSCPACEASKRYEQRELIPLFYADTSVRDEVCTYCDHKLTDLALQQAADSNATYHVAHVSDRNGRPALDFDRRPSDEILQALKKAGWRWSPRERIWVDFSRTAEVPTPLQLPPRPAPVAARPPIIRRHRTMGIR